MGLDLQHETIPDRDVFEIEDDQRKTADAETEMMLFGIISVAIIATVFSPAYRTLEDVRTHLRQNFSEHVELVEKIGFAASNQNINEIFAQHRADRLAAKTDRRAGASSLPAA